MNGPACELLRKGGEDPVATPAPASTAEAMDMVLTGLRYLAATDPTALSAQAQADCLQTLEQADAMSTAARAWFLAAFTAGHGYSEDADYSPTSWLIHRTSITKGAARGHVGWSGRAVTHPQVVMALAEGTVLTESMGRIICAWTDKLPAGCRPAADEILIAAARAGARKEDLAALAAEIYARSLPDSGDDPSRPSRPPAPGGDHLPGCGCHLRGPHPGVRRGGDRGAGGPVRPDGLRGHPDQGPAVPRRTRGRDAPTGTLHRNLHHINGGRCVTTTSPSRT